MNKIKKIIAVIVLCFTFFAILGIIGNIENGGDLSNVKYCLLDLALMCGSVYFLR